MCEGGDEIDSDTGNFTTQFGGASEVNENHLVVVFGGVFSNPMAVVFIGGLLYRE